MFEYLREFENLENLETAIYCYNEMVKGLRFYQLNEIHPENYEGYEEKKTDEEKKEYIEDICYDTLKENTREIERTSLSYGDEVNEVLKQAYELIKILRVTDNLFYKIKPEWASAK